MLVVGLNAGLSAIQAAFPGASDLMVQMSTSGISFSVILMSFFVHKIYAKISRRRTVILGEILLAATAVTAYLYHPSIVMVFLYSVLIGVASALILPATGSALIDYFDAEERLAQSGKQALCSSAGGIWFSLCGGLLANLSWYAGYLVFLLALPVLAVTLWCFPRDIPQQKSMQTGTPGRATVSWVIIQYGFITLLYVILYGVFLSNISLFVADEALGTPTTAGLIGSMSMVGGLLGGLVLKPVISKLGHFTVVFTFSGAALGFILLTFAGQAVTCCLAAVVIGMCQSIHIPHCLLALATQINPRQSVIGTLAVSCLAPNVGTLVSPVIMTNMAGFLFGPSIRYRFVLACLVACALAVLFALALRRSQLHRADPQRD